MATSLINRISLPRNMGGDFLYFILLLILFFPSFPRFVFASEEKLAKGPVDIEADSISYDRERDTYQAKGQVVINFAGGVLKADTVTLSKGNNIATAEGRVYIKTDSDILEGDKVDFDLEANTGVVYAGKMFIAKNHFYLKGERIEKKGDSDYSIKKVSLTTCDGDLPDWRLTGQELDVTVDGYGRLKGGKFYARDVPLLYVPYLLFPAKTTRQTGFLFPHLAYSRDKLGWDVELPFFLALSKSADATFYQRYMDKRGFKEGVEFRYFAGPDSYGTIYGDYLRDSARITENSGTVFREWQSPHNRWSFYFQNYTSLQPGLYLRADIARVSDNWYFKDFASHNYYLSHYSQNSDERFKKISFVGDESLGTLGSAVRIVKDWNLYNLTTLLKYTDDLTTTSNDKTVQKYPEITLTGIKQSLFGTPVNFDLSTSYSGNYRKEGQEGGLVDFKPAFSLPVNMGGNIQFTPVFEARGTFWSRSDDAVSDSDKRGSRASYRLGAELVTSGFRDYAITGQGIGNIRHEIKPELVYDYIPYVDQDDLPDFTERIEEKNFLTAALTNTLTAKLKDKSGATSYLEILRFKFSQSYDINEERRNIEASGRPRRPFGPMDMELDIKPVKYFSLSTRNRLNVSSGIWEKNNYDLNLSDSRGDSASFGYHYTRDVLEEINISLNAVLTKSVGMSYVLKRNKFDNNNLRNSLGFNYKRQCWSVGLTYANDINDRSLMLSFSLTGLGAVGQK